MSWNSLIYILFANTNREMDQHPC